MGGGLNKERLSDMTEKKKKMDQDEEEEIPLAEQITYVDTSDQGDYYTVHITLGILKEGGRRISHPIEKHKVEIRDIVIDEEGTTEPEPIDEAMTRYVKDNIDDTSATQNMVFGQIYWQWPIFDQ